MLAYSICDSASGRAPVNIVNMYKVLYRNIRDACLVLRTLQRTQHEMHPPAAVEEFN